MTQDTHRLVAIFAMLVLFAAGCASTAQYERFAQAGTTYTVAVDRLLIVAGNTAIDATSETLLQDDELSNQTRTQYEMASEKNKEYLTVISRLRTHAWLLARYFSLLNELAHSDAPDRAQQAMSGVVKSLTDSGLNLRANSLVANEDVFKSVAKISVGFIIRGLVKEELENRQETIQVELKTQEVLLQALSNDIQQRLGEILQRQEERLVIQPLIAIKPVVNPDTWIARRRRIITSQITVEELAIASDAARKLRESFQDLIAGKLSVERINTLLTDFESILAVAESINQ